MMRKPIVAGQFYTGSADLLKKELARLVSDVKEKIEARGLVSPHAGYMYSGGIAGEVLSIVKPKPCYVILGPNHSGFGKRFGLDSGRAWQTPLGKVEIDKDLAGAILESSKYVEKDAMCHNYEHSIEVQLPFLQYLHEDGFTFVPIVVAGADKDTYKAIGKEIAGAIKKSGKDAAIIASSDMTHYESQDSAKEKDMRAIKEIVALNVDSFLDTVKEYNISMCGYVPTAIMMQACVELGAKRARLVRYATSGDISGDYSAVVGYAGIIVY